MAEPREAEGLPEIYRRYLVLDFLGLRLSELGLRERVHAVNYCWARFNVNRADLVLKEAFKKSDPLNPETFNVSNEELERLERELSKGAPTEQDLIDLAAEAGPGGGAGDG